MNHSNKNNPGPSFRPASRNPATPFFSQLQKWIAAFAAMTIRALFVIDSDIRFVLK